MIPWQILEIPYTESDNFQTGRMIFDQITNGQFSGPPEFWFNTNTSSQLIFRGRHLHSPFTKAELVIAIGKCIVSLHSKNQCENLVLEKPTQALLIFPGTWHEFGLHKGTTTLHFSSSLAKKENNKFEKPCCHKA